MCPKQNAPETESSTSETDRIDFGPTNLGFQSCEMMAHADG